MATTISAVVERIDTEARELHPGRVLLTLLAAPFFVIGWVAAHIVSAVWRVITWCWVAILVGYRVANGQDPAG